MLLSCLTIKGMEVPSAPNGELSFTKGPLRLTEYAALVLAKQIINGTAPIKTYKELMGFEDIRQTVDAVAYKHFGPLQKSPALPAHEQSQINNDKVRPYFDEFNKVFTHLLSCPQLDDNRLSSDERLIVWDFIVALHANELREHLDKKYIKKSKHGRFSKVYKKKEIYRFVAPLPITSEEIKKYPLSIAIKNGDHMTERQAGDVNHCYHWPRPPLNIDCPTQPYETFFLSHFIPPSLVRTAQEGNKTRKSTFVFKCAHPFRAVPDISNKGFLVVNLSHNYCIDDCQDKLPLDLEVLNLEYANLDPNFGEFTSLKTLNLNHTIRNNLNIFNGSPPPNLTTLFLKEYWYNRAIRSRTRSRTRPVPYLKVVPTLSGMKKLEVLDLSKNIFTRMEEGCLPTSLKRLIITYNIGMQPREQKMWHGKLTHDDCHLDIGNLTYLTNLAELDFCGSNIAPFSGTQLPSSLTKLNLARNRLKGIPDLTNLVNLTDLDIRFNEIADLDVTKLPKSIKRLWIRGNRFAATTLMKLLYGNNRSWLRIDLSGLPNLEFVDMHNVITAHPIQRHNNSTRLRPYIITRHQIDHAAQPSSSPDSIILNQRQSRFLLVRNAAADALCDLIVPKPRNDFLTPPDWPLILRNHLLCHLTGLCLAPIVGLPASAIASGGYLYLWASKTRKYYRRLLNKYTRKRQQEISTTAPAS